MAYGRRRSTSRRTSYRSRTSRPSRRSVPRRSYGRRRTGGSRARASRSTVRIELVSVPGGGVARPEDIGFKPAPAPRNKPTF